MLLHHMLNIIFVIALAVSCCGCSNSASTDHIPAVKNLDLPRYMGVWYEIARLPHSFERNVSNAQAEYIMLHDGRVRVINRGKKNQKSTSATGIARARDKSGSGELEVSFFYPFYGKYRIIYLDEDYTLAIVTSDTMDYLWILARKPAITPQQLAMCLKKLQQWGFAAALLQYPNGLMLPQ